MIHFGLAALAIGVVIIFTPTWLPYVAYVALAYGTFNLVANAYIMWRPSNSFSQHWV